MANTGKVFKDSSNIYQDQARLLFSFYEKAAESIVSQEEAVRQDINKLEEDLAAVEQKRGDIWKWLLTIVAFFMYFILRKKYDEPIEVIQGKIAEKEEEFKNIFRDYKVTKMGIAYIPVAQQVAYEDKCFVVDLTDNVPKVTISLQIPRQNDLLAGTMTQMENLTSKAPIVEASDEVETVDTSEYSLSIQEVNQSDYIGKLDRSLRTISYCMNDTEIKSVELPLVTDDSKYLHFLKEFATNDVVQCPVVKVFDDKRYDADIDNFCKLNKLKESLSKDTEQFEDVLKHLMRSIALSVQTISALKMASTNKVINSSNQLLFKLLKAPYNHYSPLLEAEEIQRIREERFDYSDSIQGYEPFQLRQSSRVRYNLFADEWTAEDNSNTNVPFGVHQIYDEKLSYLNKWHQDVDAFYRSNHTESADIINNMQQTLSEYIEAYNTLSQLQKTLDSMGAEDADLENTIVKEQDNSAEVLAAFELQAKEFNQAQNDFADFMDRLQEDIALKAEKFGHVEFYDARLQDGYSNSVAVAANEVNTMDERRKPLALTNPLLAKESVLLPEPNIEDIAYEHLSLNLPSIAMNALDSISQLAVENRKKEDRSGTKCS